MIEELQGVTYWTRVSDSAFLHSQSDNDPYIHAQMDAPNLAVDKNGKSLPYEIVVLPMPGNKVEIRILVFENEGVHKEYLSLTNL